MDNGHNWQNANTPPPPPQRRAYVQPRPRPASGAGWLIGLVVLLIAGGGFLLLMVLGVAMVSSGGSMIATGPYQFQESELQGGAMDAKVVVLQIYGIITAGDGSPWGGATTSPVMIAQLDHIAQQDDVVAVVLDINSPGGEVTATDEVYHRLLRLRDEQGIPVVTCMRSVAASGGYYLAAGTDHIVANRLTITGSIGVMMPGYNIQGLLEDKLGIRAEVYKAGAMKDIGNPATPTSEAERAILQGMVQNIYGEFLQIVAAGREMDIEALRDSPAGDSRILLGSEARDLGLVDQLGYFEDALVQAKNMAGRNDARVTLLRQRVSPLAALLSAKSPHSAIREALPVKGLQLRKGQPYFICPTYF